MQLPLHLRLCTRFAAWPILCALIIPLWSKSMGADGCDPDAFHGAGIFKSAFNPVNGLPIAHVGDMVQARIKVQNLDDFDDSLTITSIVDVIHHTLGDQVSPNLLTASAVLSHFASSTNVTYSYFVAFSDGPILTNDAVAGGIDNHDGGPCATFFPQEFRVTFPDQIRVLIPGLRVTKSCTYTNTPDDPRVFYMISVSNISTNATLNNISIVDDGGTPGLTNDDIVYFIGSLNTSNHTSTNISGVYMAVHSPSTNTVVVRGTDELGLTVTNTAQCSVQIPCTPAVAITKSCPPAPVPPGGALVFTGTVTNTGNVTLSNVVILNNQPTNGAPVTNFVKLAPGEGASFSGTYIVPTNLCSITDTLTVRGDYSSVCQGGGGSITNSATATCAVTNTPLLRMTKVCPGTPPAPGEALIFTGTVTNIGDIAITNIVVVNNQPSNNTPAATIARLEPGQGVSFTGQYIVPTNVCSLTDTLTATGHDVCGTLVSTNVTQTCAVSNTPALRLTKLCPSVPPMPGQFLVFTGTVTNIGNIAVTNIVVVNNQPSNNAPVVTIARLEPGEGANFSAQYRVLPDVCSMTDTLTADGRDVCGTSVTTNVTQTCTITNTPAIVVAKFCPATPTGPGELLTFSGSVSNAGNITLTNVIVLNNQPTNNAPVFGPVSLAPGEVRTFSGSYRTPPDSCGPYTDTLTASGRDKCFGVLVTSSSTRSCPGITTPRIFIQKFCPPDPTPFGGLLFFSGIVSNAGNITLTNVLVFNNKPMSNTLVLGPIVLAPGQFVRFTNSYRVTGADCCGPYPDTLTAIGTDKCTGSNVVKTSTAVCPGITYPALSITRTCPTNPIVLGQPIPFFGIVSNSGNVTLSNVIVIDNNGEIMSMQGFGIGEWMDYTSSFTITNCGPSGFVTNTITITGNDICNGARVSAAATCIINCAGGQPLVILSPGLVGTKFGLSFPSEQGKDYLVQYIDSFAPPATNWVTITNVAGNGSIIVVEDHSATNVNRFYRVLLSP